MPESGSVTHWLHQLNDGDAAAAEPLWHRYFDRLVRLAGEKLRGTPKRAADEEDVALSAFDSFCRGATRGRYPRLHDRDNLWRLLITITDRKATNLARHEGRKKRDAGRVAADATPPSSGDSSAADRPIDRLISREPTPEFAALFAENVRLRLMQLEKIEHRQIAVLKMDRFTNAEIARKLRCSVPTVERALRIIRKTWEEAAHDRRTPTGHPVAGDGAAD